MRTWQSNRVSGLMRLGLSLSLGLALFGQGRASRAQNCDDPVKQLFGMNIDPANGAYGNPSPADLQAIGVRWVRIEWKVNLGFGFYDNVISNYRNNGIKVLLLVDYSSCSEGKPSSGAGSSEWDAYIATFVSELGTIAAHYGDGVDAWEVWNEPDLLHNGQPYDPGVPPDKYGILLHQANQAIRQHSSRPIVVGGLASGDPNYLSQAISAAGGLYADAVGVHPYGQRAPDDWPNSSWGFGNLSDFYVRYGQFGKPLWVTEIGTNAMSDQDQAQYLTNVYTLTRDQFLSQVPRVFWFCWSDGMVPAFGLYDTSGNAKPARDAYRNTAPTWDPQCGGGTTDADGDSYSPPADCNDSDPNIHPGAPEICGDGIDQDCDGSDEPCGNEVTFSYNPTAPHAGDQVTIVVAGNQGYTNVHLAASGPAAVTPTFQSADGSCNQDPNAQCTWTYTAVFPSPGTYDLTFTADPANTVYGTDSLQVSPGNPIQDDDHDGFAPPGDCDDSDPNIHPGAPEICGDGIDQDCDGSDQPCTLDQDNDGYEPPWDCDDSDPNVHPNAQEICGDGIDQDCDGSDQPCTNPDAGLPDASGHGPDAGTASDGGPSKPTVTSGCTCQSSGATPPWLLLLVLPLLVLRRRR